VARRYALADGLIDDETVVLAGQPGPPGSAAEPSWQ
jgi:hypothetical protein